MPAVLCILGVLIAVRWLQAGNEVVTVHVEGVPLRVEIADTPAARSKGLKYRKQLAADAGMLFVYPEVDTLRFWMKDTPIDLDIGFFDDRGRLLNVSSMQALDADTRHVSSRPARYALEVNPGWFSQNGIAEGALLEIGDRPRFPR